MTEQSNTDSTIGNSVKSDSKNNAKNKEPAIKSYSWLFGHLLAAELLPLLQQHLFAQDLLAQNMPKNKQAYWQIIWLNNDNTPVIGLLPKVSWSVFFDKVKIKSDTDKPLSTYKVVKRFRSDKKATTTESMSYSDWQAELIAYSQAYDNQTDSKSANFSQKNADNTPSYQHGLMGFMGYDIGAHELSAEVDIKASDTLNDDHKKSQSQQAEQPCAVLGHYDIYLSQTKLEGKTAWTLNIESDINDIESQLDHVLPHLLSYLDSLEASLEAGLSASGSSNAKSSLTTPAPLVLAPLWQKRDYARAFEQTQNYLHQGDCYQINLTQAWQGKLTSKNNNSTPSLIDYLPALHSNTQAPFAGYLALDALDDGLADSLNNNSDLSLDNNEDNHRPDPSFELLSCSPELFFTFTTDTSTTEDVRAHHIRTKPIKGTMPRSNNAEQDACLKQQLIDSAKDRSENVMIVDLLRNDLGKYAKVGSVKVPKLFEIESFSNVHHMVSTITAELKPDAHPLTVLLGSLPAGSITGTPKKRAVEIIAELEIAARGAYCGTMGYMNFDGSGQWNVLIRTLQAQKVAKGIKEVSLWAGGGITVASNCANEYQECLDKVGNLLAILAQNN